MEGELGKVRLFVGLVDGFERLSRAKVPIEPLSKRELVVQRVSNQCMPEPQPSGRPRHLTHDTLDHRLVEDLENLLSCEPGKSHECLQAELPAG